jgi:hypothetical protein
VDVGHERGGPADIGDGVARHPERGESRTVHPLVGRRTVCSALGFDRGVEGVLVSIRECSEKAVGLVGERMMAGVLRGVDPPDLTGALVGGEVVEHGEGGGDPDPG